MQFRTAHVKPRIDPPSDKNQQSFFDAGAPLLLQFINEKHKLVKLADCIKWETFENYWRKQFSDAGGQMVSAPKSASIDFYRAS